MIPVRSLDIVRKQGAEPHKLWPQIRITEGLEIDRSLPTPQCEICKSIATWLWPPEEVLKLPSLVHMPSFFSSACATHVEFIREVFGDRQFGPINPNLTWSISWRAYGRDGFLNGIWTCDVSGANSRQLRTIFEEDTWQYHSTDGDADGDTDSDNDEDIDEDIDNLWIDPRLVSRWKENCEKRCACRKDDFYRSLPPYNPSWFIDTKQYCLVPACGNMSYVTLSYVWGGVQQYLTRGAAIEQLRQPGALCDDALGLAQTIKDAIKIVPLLKERYLWVDSLCIVQDDETTKRAAIENMCSIYANSVVTIVAADGHDANYGLRGIRGVSLWPRNIILRTFPLAQYRTVTTLRSFIDYDSPPSWSRRAWTLQEAIFPSRLLIFYQDGLRWECVSSQVKHEYLGLRSLGGAKISCRYDIGDHLPDLSQLARLIQNYNRRHLSFPEDALRAFAGISTALQDKKFPGGFRSGLPVDFFDSALLWHSYGTLTRRIRLAAEDDSPLPSWSWAGWSGELDLSSWHMAMEYVEPFRGYGLLAVDGSLVQWKTHQFPSDEGIPVKSINTGAITEQIIAGTAFSLPEGWEKIDAHDEEGRVGRVSQVLESGAPVDDVLPPWRYQYLGRGLYRFPVSGFKDNAAGVSHQARFLSCRCKGARLALAEPFINTTQDSDQHNLTNFHHLRDKSGSWAGVLQVHEPLEMTTESQMSVSNMTEIELVAISSAWAYEDSAEREEETGVFILPEYFFSGRRRRGWRYEFYNVLYIEWDSFGVAYRKGLGRVDKELWESLKLWDVDLILG